MKASAESPFSWAALEVGHRPFGKAAALGRVGQQGGDHVARLVRGEEGEQLHLAAVDVPQREVGVLRVPVGHVHLAVEAHVVAVGVVEHRGGQQRVVQLGVERALVGVRSPADRDLPERLVPDGRVASAQRGKVPAGLLVGDVEAGVGDAHEGHPTSTCTDAVLAPKRTYAPDPARVLERDPAVTVVPCHVPKAREGLLEPRREVEVVVARRCRRSPRSPPTRPPLGRRRRSPPSASSPPRCRPP